MSMIKVISVFSVKVVNSIQHLKQKTGYDMSVFDVQQEVWISFI